MKESKESIGWKILESKVYNKGLPSYTRWWEGTRLAGRDLIPEILLLMKEVLDEEVE